MSPGSAAGRAGSDSIHIRFARSPRYVPTAPLPPFCLHPPPGPCGPASVQGRCTWSTAGCSLPAPSRPTCVPATCAHPSLVLSALVAFRSEGLPLFPDPTDSPPFCLLFTPRRHCPSRPKTKAGRVVKVAALQSRLVAVTLGEEEAGAGALASTTLKARARRSFLRSEHSSEGRKE